MTSLRDDDVCVTLAWFDELKVHRLHCVRVSFDYPLDSLSSLDDISGHDSHQSVVIVCINEDLDVHKLAELRICEDKDSFHDDDISWLEELSLKEAIAKLSEREKRILSLRYFRGKTQMEVAEVVGISQAQVSRIEKCALESIKKGL